MALAGRATTPSLPARGGGAVSSPSGVRSRAAPTAQRFSTIYYFLHSRRPLLTLILLIVGYHAATVGWGGGWQDPSPPLRTPLHKVYQIVPLTCAGSSDPYVVVELQPTHLFPAQQPQQTSVIKRTLNPSFSETFSLYAGRLCSFASSLY